MTRYRRSQFCGGYYFFTVVTYRRRRLLADDLARIRLRSVWRSVHRKRPFEVVAFCLLPDHLHCLWHLPEGDNDFWLRWMLIKKGFTRQYLKAGGHESGQGRSRQRKREGSAWATSCPSYVLEDEERSRATGPPGNPEADKSFLNSRAATRRDRKRRSAGIASWLFTIHAPCAGAASA